LIRFWNENGLSDAALSITAREIQRGAFESDFPQTRSFFYLRESGVHEHPDFPPAFLTVFAEQNEEYAAQLKELKKRIRKLKGQVTVRDYVSTFKGLRIDSALLPTDLSKEDCASLADGIIEPSDWSALSDSVQRALSNNGTVSLAGMEALGEQILSDLWPAIESELTRDGATAGVLDSFASVRRAHEHFAASRTRLFIGRDDFLDELTKRSCDDSHSPVVVSGDAGCGKSALLAEFASRCESDPKWAVLLFFAGALPGSSDLTTMLRHLCEALRRIGGLDDDVPDDPDELRAQFRVFLESCARTRPVVVIIDALNQVQSLAGPVDLGWLPIDLPDQVSLVVSTLDGPVLDRLQSTLGADRFIHLEELPEDDQAELVRRFLSVRRKRLTERQLERFLDERNHPDAGLPLWLIVALEEIVLFGSYEALDARIDNLPGRIPDLFSQVLGRLEHDHGRDLVEHVCRWLAVSRYGLLETEVLELLQRHGPQTSLLAWTRFYRSLQPYLRLMAQSEHTESSDMIAIYHDQLALAINHRFLSRNENGISTDVESSAIRKAHSELMDYFEQMGRTEKEPLRWNTERARSLSELPYHQIRSASWSRLDQTLGDAGFIEAKVRVDQVTALLSDYEDALAMVSRAPQMDRLRTFQRAVQLGTAELTARPENTFQTLYNLLRRDARLHQEFEKLCQSHIAAGRVLMREWTVPNQRIDSPKVGTIRDDASPIRAICGLAEFDSLVTVNDGGKLRKWRFEDASPIDIRMLPVSNTSTLCVATCGDLVVGCTDGAVLHSRASGSTHTFHKEDQQISSVVISRNGQRAFAVSWSGFLWRFDSGNEGWTTVDQSNFALNKIALADGDTVLVIGDDQGNLEFRLSTEPERVLTRQLAHPGGILALSVSRDGQTIFCGGVDHKVSIWRRHGHWAQERFIEYPDWITALAADPDGKVIVGDAQGHVFRWSAVDDLRQHLVSFECGVAELAISANGTRLAVLDTAGNCTILDMHSLAAHSHAAVHEARIICGTVLTGTGRFAASTTDGRVFIWRLPDGSIETQFETESQLNALAATAGAGLLGAARDGTLIRFDLSKEGCPSKLLLEDLPPVSRLSMNPARNELVVACETGDIIIADLGENLMHRKVKRLHDARIEHLLVIERQQRAITACRSGDVFRTDLTDLYTSFEFGSLFSDPSERHVGGVTGLLSVDGGEQIVTTGTDATLRRWTSLGGWIETIDLFAEDSSITACCADPLKPLVIAGSDGGWISVWRGPELPLATWSAHKREVTGLFLFPNVNQFLSTGEDGFVNVWDLTRNVRLLVYPVNSPIRSLWYDAGSHRIVLSDQAGRIHILEALGLPNKVAPVAANRE